MASVEGIDRQMQKPKKWTERLSEPKGHKAKSERSEYDANDETSDRTRDKMAMPSSEMDADQHTGQGPDYGSEHDIGFRRSEHAPDGRAPAPHRDVQSAHGRT